MTLSGGLEALFAVLIGLCAAGLLFLWWVRATSTKYDTARILMNEAKDSTVFIFEDEVLVDATPRARNLLEQADDHGSDWDRLVSALSPAFPDMRQQCNDLANAGRRTLVPSDGSTKRIDAEHWNGLARIVILEPDDSDQPADSLVIESMRQEIVALRSIGTHTPQLIWRHDSKGLLVWANRAYLQLAEAAHPTEGDEPALWPPSELFQGVSVPAGTVPVVERQWLKSDGRLHPQCFEITSVRVDDDTMHFAVDITPVVDAQDAQNKFVQTLSKTFAQLSVGLAVFDRDRRLVLFNPALIDLLNLPTEVLINRPLLGTFLDRLREARMIPEPKDYTSWRTQIEALESEAQEGNYQQTWDLPSGLTYRVTGRPHPDGAIAFLFEDISEDLSLTRRFRSQIDLGQSILDNIDEAIAAFSASGTMLVSNRTYRRLWQTEGHLGLAECSLSDQLLLWQDGCAPSPAWEKFTSPNTKDTWSDAVTMHNGTTLECHFRPLPNGDRLVRFVPQLTGHDTSLPASRPIDVLDSAGNG